MLFRSEGVPVSIRVIAATNRDLQDMVRRGQFREDLYYRLSVIPLVIPPLRDRREDIPLLLEYFMKRFSGLLGKKVDGISPEAMRKCLEYPWPGNIRELINAVEYAINLEEGAQILPESLPPRLRAGGREKHRLPVNTVEIKPLEQLEKESIGRALEHYGWSEEGKMRAAAALGISRATIYRKISKYRLGDK